MAKTYGPLTQYHQASDIATALGSTNAAPGSAAWPPTVWGNWVTTYDFQNFFHPFVGPLIQKLNEPTLPACSIRASSAG